MTPHAAYSVRRAAPADLPVLLRFRREMLITMGQADPSRLDVVDEATLPWAERGMAAGEVIGWVAEAEGEAIGSLMLCAVRMPPGYRVIDGRHALLMGMFVVPGWRRRGVARAIVEAAVAWAESQGFAIVTLQATDVGRGLYESLGFEATNEMRYFTSHAYDGD